MAPHNVISVIFHFRVTRAAARTNQSLKSIIFTIQCLFGEAFHTWVQANYTIFPNIKQDINKMIIKFQEVQGAMFPQSIASIREQLASIMAYTQESLFNPNMNVISHAEDRRSYQVFRNYFPENEHWGYSPMMNAAFEALTTMQCDWHKFIGPCCDILLKWSNTARIHDNHLNRIPRSLAVFTKQDWATLPSNIKQFVVWELPEVATVLDLNVEFLL